MGTGPGEVRPAHPGARNGAAPPAPAGGTEEMGFRDIGRVLRRGTPLILGATLLGAGLGVALSLRAAPVYEAGASLRVEEQRAQLPGFDVPWAPPPTGVVETAMEELRTRSLAEEVAHTLGLRVRVALPAEAARSAVLASASAPRSAAGGSFVLRRAPGGRFAVAGRPGAFAPGAPLPLGGGVVVRLAPSALRHPVIRLELRPLAEAAAEVQQRAAVARPNEQADVVRVSYEAADPNLARDVANALAAHFLARRQRAGEEEAARAVRLLEQQLAGPSRQPTGPGGDARDALHARLVEARVAAALLGPGARVIDPATLPRTPVRPRRGLILGLATLAGLVAGVVAALARSQVDSTVRTPEELRRAVHLPVLGAVPRVRGGRRTAFGAVAPWAADGGRPRARRGGGAAVAEAFRAVRATAWTAARRRDTELATVVVTSHGAGDGKSTTAANLAFVAAREGLRVLLVDADPARGLSGMLGAPDVPGFYDVLWGTVSPGEALRRVEPPGGGVLHFLPAGSPPGPVGLPGRTEVARALAALREGFDLVVVDSPGLGASLDAAVLGAGADGVILVARAGRTRSDVLRRAVERLEAVDAPVLGVLLNEASERDT